MPLATQYVSGSELVAAVPAANVAKAGSAQVQVVNPAPGGGTSNAITFEISEPVPVSTFNRVDYSKGYGYPSVVAADFNGDGKLDVAAVSLGSYFVSVYLGDGHGGFAHKGDYATGSGNDNDSLVVGDFNGDGKLDLAVRGVSVMLGNGDGSFQPPVSYAAGNNALATGDFNGDGILDLASTDPSGVVFIQMGNGDGSFQDPVPVNAGSNPYPIAVGDFNGDGIPDLAVGLQVDAGGVVILVGNGDGTFQAPVAYPSLPNPVDIFAADMNGDGVLDLVVTSYSAEEVSVFLGKGDGTFLPRRDYEVGVPTFRGGVADLNGDGNQDVVVTPWYNDTNFYVLRGHGDGSLGKPTAYPTGSCPLGTAFGDFNDDGVMDVVVAEQCGAISVFLGSIIALQPESLDFGKVTVGQQATLATQLTNVRVRAASINNIKVEGGQGAFSETNNCGNNLAGGGSCTVTVVFAPAGSGSFGARVVIPMDAPGTPQSVYLSGSGTTKMASEKK